MRRVQAAHHARGFDDIGYHLVIMPSGRVFAGRPLGSCGAHVAGHNLGTVGVALAGHFDLRDPSPRAIVALRQCVDRVIPDGPGGALLGHCDLAPKSCPGRQMRRLLRSLAATRARESDTLLVPRAAA